MPSTLTTRERAQLLVLALSKIDEPELRAALEGMGAPTGGPRVAINAANALRRSRSIESSLARPPYRAVLPHLAGAVASDCLAATVEALGERSEDPSSEELLQALDAVRGSFSDTTIAVMLASVATDDLPASARCLEVVISDERYGLSGWRDRSVGPVTEPPGDAGRADGTTREPTARLGERKDETAAGEERPLDRAASDPRPPPPDLRAARRERRKAAAQDRRRRQETAQRAAERVRSLRRSERSAPPTPAGSAPSRTHPRPAPTLFRPPVLTPAQRHEFDATDPLVGAVVYVWVPFDPDLSPDDESGCTSTPTGSRDEVGTDGPQEPIDVEPARDGAAAGTGKPRPCVVIGVSADHLLVRPGYSEGGRRSRDWTSVPVRHWHEAGLDQPTWIGAGTLRVPRPEQTSPPRRLTTADWNALW